MSPNPMAPDPLFVTYTWNSTLLQWELSTTRPNAPPPPDMPPNNPSMTATITIECTSLNLAKLPQENGKPVFPLVLAANGQPLTRTGKKVVKNSQGQNVQEIGQVHQLNFKGEYKDIVKVHPESQFT
jgi:hypothetical protein